MPEIRTTFQPGNVIHVDEAEFLDLDRQGVVLEVVPPAHTTTGNSKVKMVSTGDRKTSKPEPEEA